MTARGENAPVQEAPVKTTDEKKAKKLSLAKNISFAALFAALCCVSTLFISVPLPASGYFNTGDIFVLLAGWFLGPLYGGAAAGVGSMLADIISGYAVYAPATFFVKALDAVAAYLVWPSFEKSHQKRQAGHLAESDFRPRGRGADGVRILLLRGRRPRHGHRRRRQYPREYLAGRMLSSLRLRSDRRFISREASPRIFSQASIKRFYFLN